MTDLSVKILNLTNFRNLRQASITAHPRFNLVTGSNGAGKTSILEAINYISRSASFRGTKNRSLVHYQNEDAYIYSQLERKFITHEVGIKLGSENILQLDGNPARVIDLVQLVPCVVISPDVVEDLIQGPEERRKLLNQGVYYYSEDFVILWNEVKSLASQRSVVSAKIREILRTTGKWDEQLLSEYRSLNKKIVPISEILVQYYQGYANLLIPVVNRLLHQVLPNLDIKIKFYPGWNQDQELAEILELRESKDIESGRVSQGIHRFDLKLECFNQAVQNVLSRGQLKILAIVLKVAQGFVFKSHQNSGCIYLVDDVAAELDSEKQRLLLDLLLSSNNQVFMTCISSNLDLALINSLIPEFKLFVIEQGRVALQNLVNNTVDLSKLEQEVLDLTIRNNTSLSNLSLDPKFSSSQGENSLSQANALSEATQAGQQVLPEFDAELELAFASIVEEGTADLFPSSSTDKPAVDSGAVQLSNATSATSQANNFASTANAVSVATSKAGFTEDDALVAEIISYANQKDEQTKEVTSVSANDSVSKEIDSVANEQALESSLDESLATSNPAETTEASAEVALAEETKSEQEDCSDLK